MWKRTKLFILFLLMLTIVSCKKASNEEYCWQLIDPLGNPINSVCGKTESEMLSSYPTPCSYYRLGNNYCWFIDGTIFLKDKPEDYINHFLQCYNHTSAIRVTCDYCQNWYTRQKNTYKPNNTVSFGPILVKQYCGDTVNTLYQGREITLRETTDSLIKLQFSNNGIF
jgi:hypothetical protein